jgi:DNA-binding GntR family transcriptional regulator
LLILALRRRVNHISSLVHTPDELRARCQAQHRRSLVACRAGDTQAAIDALVAHLDDATGAVIETSHRLQARSD